VSSGDASGYSAPHPFARGQVGKLALCRLETVSKLTYKANRSMLSGCRGCLRPYMHEWHSVHLDYTEGAHTTWLGDLWVPKTYATRRYS
jgi:hypothetical protein